MHELIHYFSTIPSVHRALILAVGIAFFWFIESVVPYRKYTYHKWQHAGINIFFTVTTMVVNFCLALLLLITADWSRVHHFGILNLLPPLQLWLFALIGLLLLDFIGAYLVHYIEHKIPFFWRFHLIHHTDTTLDTTSANRHHPGESVLRFVFTTIGVLVIGSPMWLVFLYQTISVVATQFNHANIVLPSKLDTLLGYIIISPDMHKVHHHYRLPYTDSNYGNIFSVWDRLFGTYKTIDRDQLIYGIDTHMNPDEHNRLKNLLAIPFQKKRMPQVLDEKK